MGSLALPPTNRSWPAPWRQAISFRSPFHGGELHRFDDFRISRAAAQVSGQVVADVVFRRVPDLVQQLASHQYEFPPAESALGSPARAGCLPERVELGGAFQ